MADMKYIILLSCIMLALFPTKNPAAKSSESSDLSKPSSKNSDKGKGKGRSADTNTGTKYTVLSTPPTGSTGGKHKRVISDSFLI
ncbi:unnamed protein product [Lasius platythorax]|uniref:Uncharacterized protein n=1 Tax=Lasius platythorax TaxID=488582 RepID=A0AAV2ND49_9HYME